MMARILHDPYRQINHPKWWVGVGGGEVTFAIKGSNTGHSDFQRHPPNVNKVPD